MSANTNYISLMVKAREKPGHLFGDMVTVKDRTKAESQVQINRGLRKKTKELSSIEMREEISGF